MRGAVLDLGRSALPGEVTLTGCQGPASSTTCFLRRRQGSRMRLRRSSIGAARPNKRCSRQALLDGALRAHC